jgi:asparagine synthase (glutamine-hydrolysing)
LSGIVGIFNRSGAPVEKQLLRELTQLLAYRGPDALEVWTDGAIGFGHAMLRTTRESRNERQPANLDGKFWITADCRLDQRSELRVKMAKQGVSLSEPAPDSELILNAYAVWGTEWAQHLAGDFSFALWDAVQKILYLVRDRFGIRPFYYAALGDLLVFSNTLNCIREHPAVSGELNDTAVGDFLLFGLNCERSTTTFRDVQRLPPAHLLAVSQKQIEAKRYWTVPTDGRIRYGRAADYVEHFESLLDAAVSDRMRTERLGILLSGGLDSGSVAATAAALRARFHGSMEFRAYTVTHASLLPDHDSEPAHKIADYLGLPIRSLTLDSLRVFDRWDEPALMWPEPVEDPLFAGLYDQFRPIAAECRTVFSGEGSDNLMLFEMWPYAADMLRRREWRSFCSQLFAYLVLRGARLDVRRLTRRFFRKTPSLLFPSWIAADFARRMNLEERWRSVQQSWNGTDGPRHPVVPKGYASLALPHWTFLFEQSDPGVTRCPVEVLYPFLDLRIVSYLLALPPLPWFFEKHLLREAMRQRLPETIRVRPKTAMSRDPVLALLRSKPGERWWAEVAWREEMHGYVDRAALVPPDGDTDAELARTNLRPYCLNFWLRALRSEDYNSLLERLT